VRWEGFDASHDSWVPRCDITPKALMAYEEFLRRAPRAGRTTRETFNKKLTSFIGRNGKYSVLAQSDDHRTSRMSASHGEREEAGARPDGDDDPKTSMVVPKSASDADASAAAGSTRARKPPGFYRV